MFGCLSPRLDVCLQTQRTQPGKCDSQRARREDHERQLVTQLDPLGRHLPSQHIAQIWHKIHSVHIYLWTCNETAISDTAFAPVTLLSKQIYNCRVLLGAAYLVILVALSVCCIDKSTGE
jgi:hypothetical protein